MQLVSVRNATRGTIVAQRAEVARSSVRRFLGLMGRATWTDTDGLLIRPCNAIHTFFMRMPIDVVFVGARDIVVDIAAARRPWRAGPIAWRAKWALELPEGAIVASGTAVDDRLIVEGAHAKLDRAHPPH